jgi:hypothetical protein
MNKYIVFVLGYMGLIMLMCHGSAGAQDTEPWSNVQQMETDVSSYKADGFSPTYFAKIEQRIAATANVQVADKNQLTPLERNQIDNALCILWECKDRLSTITSIIASIQSVIKQYTLEKNEEKVVAQGNLIEQALVGANTPFAIDQRNPIAQALVRANTLPAKVKKSVDALMQTIKSKFNEFAKRIYKNDDKDYIDLVIFMAFLHGNLKQYNAFYSFGSVVAEILMLYEDTKNDQIKNMIKVELKAIPIQDKEIGLYGNKIKDFSKSLRTILSE